MAQKQKRLRFDNTDFVHRKQPRRQIFRPGKYVLRVRTPIQRRDLVVEIGKCSDQLEGEEFLLEARGAPDLEELPRGDGDEGPAGAEGDSIHGMLEGHAVEDNVSVEVDEVAAVVIVDGEEEHAIGGGSEAANV